MKKNKVAVLIGTRPGIIKMAPIVHELDRQNIPRLIIHTGQHYSLNMDKDIMRDVGLDKADHQITRPDDCISHAEQTAYMLVKIEEILLEQKPDVLLVCGDANTNLAGALAARKIHVKVGHVEAGLRSFDWRMPEEHNRIIIDHISEYLFAPTSLSREHLVRDGVRGDIFVVGNTIVDATLEHARIARETQAPFVLEMTGGQPFCLLTLHREENVDNNAVVSGIISSLEHIANVSSKQIIFPLHPRTKKRFEEFGLFAKISGIKGLKIVEPLGYLNFIAMLEKASAVFTDSGGIQEESCILQVPCLTLRTSTERPETIDVGANRLAGTDPEKIISVFNEMMSEKSEKKWPNPYGDGQTSRRIVETCLFGKPKDEL
ncbi:non-hydrolyzing UDP-N-acetylglucosamine 2-epimerase [Sulfurovum sp.]|uniref:non-hydrolyzing UDP-N-acetylglucosamine 2-epimerase n=1 Tax=Sulfurovum sp. TaxID=1969726 RepID=UPI00356A2C54